MCDYSLHHVASAAAKVGDKLVSTTFPMSSTRGFAVAGQPDVAICVPPGTELAFEQNVRCDHGFGLLRRRTIPHQVARFRQINMDQPYANHDALEFPDGQIVMLTHLTLGQHAVVLQLPVDPKVVQEPRVEPVAQPVDAVPVIAEQEARREFGRFYPMF